MGYLRTPPPLFIIISSSFCFYILCFGLVENEIPFLFIYLLFRFYEPR